MYRQRHAVNALGPGFVRDLDIIHVGPKTPSDLRLVTFVQRGHRISQMRLNRLHQHGMALARWSVSRSFGFVPCSDEVIEAFVLGEEVADGTDGFAEVIAGASGGLS